MYYRTTIVLAAALALGLLADTADVNRYRTPVLAGSPGLGPVADPGPMPEIFVSVVQQTSGKQAPLQPQSRLEIVRYVSGEFAKVMKPIPAGKKGFKVEVGKKLDESEQGMCNGERAVDIIRERPLKFGKDKLNDLKNKGRL